MREDRESFFKVMISVYELKKKRKTKQVAISWENGVITWSKSTLEILRRSVRSVLTIWIFISVSNNNIELRITS